MLMLMGGGLVLWGATRSPSRACMEARAAMRPDAETICRVGSGGGSGGSGGYHGASSGMASSVGTATALAAVSRGGFGATGASAAGS